MAKDTNMRFLEFAESPLFEEDRKESLKRQQDAYERHYRLLQDLKTVAATEAGHRVFAFLLGECRVHSSIYTGNATTFYNSAKQDLGNLLWERLMEADPEICCRFIRQRSTMIRNRRLPPASPGKAKE